MLFPDFPKFKINMIQKENIKFYCQKLPKM